MRNQTANQLIPSREPRKGRKNVAQGERKRALGFVIRSNTDDTDSTENTDKRFLVLNVGEDVYRIV